MYAIAPSSRRRALAGPVAVLTCALLASSVSVADPVDPLAEACEVTPTFTPNFEPELEWAWTGSPIKPAHNQVMMTPVVIDVSGDGIPDVLFNSFQGSNYNSDGVLRAVDGADGSDLWAVTDPLYAVRAASTIAAGDIDDDGLPEICTVGQSTQVICFEHDGTYKLTLSGSSNSWGGPSLADLDGDGSVEIINGNRVYSSTGALLWSGADTNGGTPGTGPVSFAADIDQDGLLEVVNDRAIYEHDGSLKCHAPALGHGLAGVGDFDGDDEGEVVVVWSGRVSLMDDDCTVLWTTLIPGGGAGGAPNIADFDGDGEPEVGVAGASRYLVLETDGSVKWSAVVQDLSSNRTGSSTFDFEGDGSAEVVYADERRLRIYDGATGIVRFDVPHSSATTYENPVIADVDGDGNAEIVTCANDYFYAGFHGIRVFRDANDGWVNTRGIWNQHAYSVTNVEDDGSIPAYPDTNWLSGLNTFRSNTQGVGDASPFAAPDLTVVDVIGECVPESYDVTLCAHVHNQGDAPASAGVEVSFYLGDPGAGGALLDIVAVGTTFGALTSQEVCTTVTAPGGSGEIYAVVDEAGAEQECDESNNLGSGAVDLSCSPNDPPVAVCEDLVLFADEECLADGSVDGGSYDPDGDPITLVQSPVGPYGPGDTDVSLTVCDDSDACDTCTATITVIDDTPPVVDCNAPASILPSDAPVAFTATADDACGADVSVSGITCFAVNGAGKVIDKSGSCVVSASGATVTIADAGGVGTTIGWTATAVDFSGNASSIDCAVQVAHPGNGSGCNQGLGNGAEGCDPGNSNHTNPTNDESGGTPGNGGRKNK